MVNVVLWFWGTMKQTIEIDVPEGYEIGGQHECFDCTSGNACTGDRYPYIGVKIPLRKKTTKIIVFVPDEEGELVVNPYDKRMMVPYVGREDRGTGRQRYRREEREESV